MVKKVMVLVLSFLMIFCLMADFSVVTAAEEGVNVVSIKYYADAELTQEITEVTEGEEIYAALSFANTKLAATTVTVGYDAEYLELLDPSGVTVPISDTPIEKGTAYVKQNKIAGIKAATTGVFPKLQKIGNTGVVSVSWGGNVFSDKKITEEQIAAVLRFKTTKKGITALTIPYKNESINSDYDISNSDGIQIVTFSDPYNYVTYDDCDIKISSLTIKSRQLETSILTDGTTYADLSSAVAAAIEGSLIEVFAPCNGNGAEVTLPLNAVLDVTENKNLKNTYVTATDGAFVKMGATKITGEKLYFNAEGKLDIKVGYNAKLKEALNQSFLWTVNSSSLPGMMRFVIKSDDEFNGKTLEYSFGNGLDYIEGDIRFGLTFSGVPEVIEIEIAE